MIDRFSGYAELLKHQLNQNVATKDFPHRSSGFSLSAIKGSEAASYIVVFNQALLTLKQQGRTEQLRQQYLKQFSVHGKSPTH